MLHDAKSKAEVPSFASLYPQLSPGELAEAQENFRRYVAVVVRIAERLYAEEETQRRQLPPAI